MVVTGPMSELTVWCPSCGTEYRAGSQQCVECRVALVAEQPEHVPGGAEFEDEEAGLVELGEWPKLQAQLLRRRLETASVPVMIEWSSDIGGPVGTLLVPEEQADFASAVVNEIDVDEEIADDSPHAYVQRIEEHLASAAGLLEDLRTKLDALESEGRL
jgi:hypothetical protein